jgi:hypothetical protein
MHCISFSSRTLLRLTIGSTIGPLAIFLQEKRIDELLFASAFFTSAIDLKVCDLSENALDEECVPISYLIIKYV